MKPILFIDKPKAKQINELEPGDVIFWPSGSDKRMKAVLRLFPTPAGKLYTVVMEDVQTGDWTIQRLGAERLVGLA